MKKLFVSLFLIAGSYAAIAQSDAKVAGGPIIRLYGLPAIVNPGTGRISCGREDGICAEIQTKTVYHNDYPILIKVYVHPELPLEIEAKKVSVQELNNKSVIKFEE